MSQQSEAIQDWRRRAKYSLPVEEGVLVAVTRIHKAPELFAGGAPYWVGIVELEGGKKVVGQLVSKEGWKPKIGERVRATRRILWADGQRGVIHYGLKWKRAN